MLYPSSPLQVRGPILGGPGAPKAGALWRSDVCLEQLLAPKAIQALHPGTKRPCILSLGLSLGRPRPITASLQGRHQRSAPDAES